MAPVQVVDLLCATPVYRIDALSVILCTTLIMLCNVPALGQLIAANLLLAETCKRICVNPYVNLLSLTNLQPVTNLL